MGINIFNLTDSSIAGGANINGAKVQSTLHFGAPASQHGTIVAATTYVLGGAGVRTANSTILYFSACIEEAIATGNDRTVSVDLQKSTGGGAYATILSSPIQFTNSSVLYASLSAMLTNNTVTTNDRLRVVVAVAGAAGAQAQGLSVDGGLRETAG